MATIPAAVTAPVYMNENPITYATLLNSICPGLIGKEKSISLSFEEYIVPAPRRAVMTRFNKKAADSAKK